MPQGDNYYVTFTGQKKNSNIELVINDGEKVLLRAPLMTRSISPKNSENIQMHFTVAKSTASCTWLKRDVCF